MRNYTFAGGTAVVTGAASGIGEALAHALATRGSDLVLLDRDAERLAGVAAAIRAAHPGRTVTEHLVDLGDAAATTAVGEEILATYPRITLLVNNAGVALGGRFDQVTIDEFEWLFAINFHAVVRLTHILLPALQASPGSHLVNLSSVFGIMAPPGQSAYAASKFAIRGFTESLRQELLADRVGVTVVHPGGIRTRIAESARIGSGVSAEEAEQREEFNKLLTIDPAVAAAKIVAGIEQRKARVLIGASAAIPDALVRVLPTSYAKLLAGGQKLAARQAAKRAAARR